MQKIFFAFDKYMIQFPFNLKFKLYDEHYFNGIIFYKGDYRYDLCHNVVDWNRIIISCKDGSYKDLPFHEGTWHFLPDGVTIRKINAQK